MSVLVIKPTGNALNPFAGAETRIWILNSALVKKKFQLSILHSINSLGFEDKNLRKKCFVHYYKDLKLLGMSDWYFTDFNLFFVFKLFKIIRKQKFDIIQLERPWGFLILKLLAKKKTFLIYDSQLVEGEYINTVIKEQNSPKILRPLMKLFAKIYEKLVVKLASVVVVLSEHDRNYYVKNFKIKKNKTILIQTPSAINPQSQFESNLLKNECRKKLGLPLDKTIAIFHGGFSHHPNKEAADLIQNYIAQKINNPDIMFVLAGHNIEKFKNGNVISLGFVEDLKDLLFSADFAVVPIITGGGMRTKCMDYIVTGLPFIITKIGIKGIDFLEEGKDYLAYDEVNHEFLKGINMLHNNKEMRQQIHQNLLKKSKIFNRSIFENQFLKLFSKLINHRTEI